MFVERFNLKYWEGDTQQEPVASVTLTISGTTLRANSADGLEVAIARLERALTKLGQARSDAYLHEPHRAMGVLP